METEVIYFFEVPTEGGARVNYAGTLNQFFGLVAERGAAFNGTFLPSGSATPTELHESKPSWEQEGVAYRRANPDQEALWATCAPFAKRAG